MFTSCGDQHKAQSLVKDFLNENLVEQDCSYERFSRLTPTAMISFDQMKVMRQNVSKLPYVKKNINYNDAAYPDTLLYLRATYKLTNHQGEKQEVTQNVSRHARKTYRTAKTDLGTGRRGRTAIFHRDRGI